MARMTALLPLMGVLALVDISQAMIYERCQLANELRRQGVPEKDLSDWVCLAYQESRYDTNAEGRLNWDKSVDHGLFQISDIYWCDWSNREPGRKYKNVCGKNCDAFHDNDISDDLACVMKIHKEHQRLQGNGFMAWVAWKQHCRGSDMSSYTADCERTTTTVPGADTQSHYGEPSWTNAHTHFNNLSPLLKQLMRSVGHNKGRLVPYALGKHGRKGQADRKAAKASQRARPATTTVSTRPTAAAGSGAYGHNVFLRGSSTPTTGAPARPHPFSGNVFFGAAGGPQSQQGSSPRVSHPYTKNMFLSQNGAGSGAVVTRRPSRTTTRGLSTSRSLTTRAVPSDSRQQALLTTRRPATTRTTPRRPTTMRRTTTRRPTTKPTTRRPAIVKSAARRPIAKPTTRRPKTTKRTTRRPITTKRTTRRPVTTKRTTRRPVTTKRTTRRPVTTKPTTRRPVTTKRTTRRPAAPKDAVTGLPRAFFSQPTLQVHAWSTPLTTYRPSIFNRSGGLRTAREAAARG